MCLILRSTIKKDKKYVTKEIKNNQNNIMGLYFAKTDFFLSPFEIAECFEDV